MNLHRAVDQGDPDFSALRWLPRKWRKTLFWLFGLGAFVGGFFWTKGEIEKKIVEANTPDSLKGMAAMTVAMTKLEVAFNEMSTAQAQNDERWRSIQNQVAALNRKIDAKQADEEQREFDRRAFIERVDALTKALRSQRGYRERAGD